MKILIGAFAHETNSFCTENVSYEEWMQVGYREGDILKELYEGKPHAIGGMLQALKDTGETVDVIYGVDMTRPCISGGIVEQEIMDTFVEKMLDDIRENGPLDGILVSMHGAMQTTEFDDPEAEVIRRFREAAGEKTVIAVSTDLHAYISNQMLEQADFVCGYHTYPHVDYFETGYRAAALMMDKLRGRQLKTLKIHIPMIVPPSVYSTMAGPFQELMDYGKNFVKQNQIADYSIYQMQPWLDIETGGSSILVVGEQEEVMQKIADDLAARLLEMRYVLQPNQKSIDEVIDIAIANGTEEPVILVDCADSPNAGASGDSMDVAKRIFERNPNIRSAVVVNDKNAVKRAFTVGVGNTAVFHIGGSIDLDAPVLEAEGYVRSLHNGEFIAEGPASRGMVQRLGRTAVIRFGKMDVVVCEAISYPGDPQLYRAFGIEPTLYQLIGVKACTSFRAAYSRFTSLIFETDTFGSAAVNLKRLNFKKLSRDFWPWNTLEDYQIHERFWGRI